MSRHDFAPRTVLFALFLSLLMLSGCAAFDAASGPSDEGDADADVREDVLPDGKSPGCAPGTAGADCRTCEVGTYCAGGAAEPVNCADIDSWDHDSDPASECVLWIECEDTQFVNEPGSATQDRSCGDCAEGAVRSSVDESACIVPFEEVSAGTDYACGVRSLDQKYSCWGRSMEWRPDTEFFKSVSAGAKKVCGIRDSDRSVTCWPKKGYVQAFEVPPGLESASFQSISVGIDHACGLLENSAVECWGEDDKGQVSETPLGKKFSMISAGRFHTCGIDESNDQLICWGDRVDRLYNEAAGHYPAPPSERFSGVSVGASYACGILKSSSEIECWGDLSRLSADKPLGGVQVDSISAGIAQLCAVPSAPDQGVYCWGKNSSAHHEVAGAPDNGNFSAITVGFDFSCAIRQTDSSLFCWGVDSEGQVTGAP